VNTTTSLTSSALDWGGRSARSNPRHTSFPKRMRHSFLCLILVSAAMCACAAAMVPSVHCGALSEGPHAPSPNIYMLDHRVRRLGLQRKRPARSWRRAGRRGRQSAVSRGVQKLLVPATNLTLISGPGFCAGKAGESAPLVLCAFNGRILLANSQPLSFSTLGVSPK
jgi:hypothetical protein